MKHCRDNAACQQSPCELRRDAFWCPLELFMDLDRLQAAGAVFDADTPTMSRHVIHEAFDSIYDNAYFWFDRIPSELKHVLVNHKLPERLSSNIAFGVYGYRLGCALTYIYPQTRIFRSSDPGAHAVIIRSVEEVFGHSDAEVLVLEGRPMFVSRLPYVWSSLHARDQYDAMWRQHTTVYHADIVSLADTIADVLRQQTGSYMGVHMRRGDFVSLGLLKEGADVAKVQARIAECLQPAEPFYLATNEHDTAVLDSFRSLGAVLWDDVMRLEPVQAAMSRLPVLQRMACFEDYVGLVEQLVCAQSRMFLGTCCSSFTGQISNLRKHLYGDDVFHSLPCDDQEGVAEAAETQRIEEGGAEPKAV